MGPMSNSEKLDKVIGLIIQMTEPMARTLKEIKASNRSRWIVLLCMATMVAVVSYMSVHVLNQISVVTDKLAIIQTRSTLTTFQTHQLINLAEETASTLEIKEELENIERLAEPTPENIIQATKALPHIDGKDRNGTDKGETADK